MICEQPPQGAMDAGAQRERDGAHGGLPEHRLLLAQLPRARDRDGGEHHCQGQDDEGVKSCSYIEYV